MAKVEDNIAVLKENRMKRLAKLAGTAWRTRPMKKVEFVESSGDSTKGYWVGTEA